MDVLYRGDRPFGLLLICTHHNTVGTKERGHVQAAVGECVDVLVSAVLLHSAHFEQDVRAVNTRPDGDHSTSLSTSDWANLLAHVRRRARALRVSMLDYARLFSSQRLRGSILVGGVLLAANHEHDLRRCMGALGVGLRVLDSVLDNVRKRAIKHIGKNPADGSYPESHPRVGHQCASGDGRASR